MIHCLKVITGVVGGALLFASTAFASEAAPTVVPEPATLSLLALGGGALYLFQRRIRK